jgi:uncharacterized membrane protein (DUF4010 family)
MQFLQQIPQIFIDFMLTLVFSLLIGFEQRSRSYEKDKALIPFFGTDRTFTFIGILGFILYVLDAKNMILFTTGAALLSILLAVFYYVKTRDFKSYGMTSIVVALITYSLGPIVITQPKWLIILIVVSILLLVESKTYFKNISAKIDIVEFGTLAKFLVIAGVILPLVPRDTAIPFINLTPYQIWITVVVVSSISYLSYLLQKFVFKKSGVTVSGILGGLYSSTATTVILAKKSKEAASGSNQYASSIVIANSMMYIRILLLMLIFNFTLGMLLLPYFITLIVVSLVSGIVIHFLKKAAPEKPENLSEGHSNPLELKIAALFAVLFVVFSVLTHYVIQYYGNTGLSILSFIVGFTDIDPFLLNLFQSSNPVGLDIIGKAALHAIISNNILKMVYTYIFADKYTKKLALAGIGLVTVVNIILAFLL